MGESFGSGLGGFGGLEGFGGGFGGFDGGGYWDWLAMPPQGTPPAASALPPVTATPWPGETPAGPPGSPAPPITDVRAVTPRPVAALGGLGVAPVATPDAVTPAAATTPGAAPAAATTPGAAQPQSWWQRNFGSPEAQRRLQQGLGGFGSALSRQQPPAGDTAPRVAPGQVHRPGGRAPSWDEIIAQRARVQQLVQQRAALQAPWLRQRLGQGGLLS
jgi:hypothetical protein